MIRFALAPNEAASWRFKTPSSGEGLIELSQATFATETSRMLTISETPCDFDEAKAMRKIAGCYQWFVNDGGIQFQIAPAHVGWNP